MIKAIALAFFIIRNTGRTAKRRAARAILIKRSRKKHAERQNAQNRQFSDKLQTRSIEHIHLSLGLEYDLK
jgi:hypothetical protein